MQQRCFILNAPAMTCGTDRIFYIELSRCEYEVVNLVPLDRMRISQSSSYIGFSRISYHDDHS